MTVTVTASPGIDSKFKRPVKRNTTDHGKRARRSYGAEDLTRKRLAPVHAVRATITHAHVTTRGSQRQVKTARDTRGCVARAPG